MGRTQPKSEKPAPDPSIDPRPISDRKERRHPGGMGNGMGNPPGLWIFAYGSLIWRPGFEFEKRRIAKAQGWKRRFWQGSQDHRGTPDDPGRVATLVPDDSACEGMAFFVSGDRAKDTLAYLDLREKNGYERQALTLEFLNGERCRGIVYLAPVGNPAWLGPADLADIAADIHRARGPSGTNREYLYRLSAALRDAGIQDIHISILEDLVRTKDKR